MAEALSDAWPGLVWECTHVGGNRFAPNVLVVPDGVAYGRLTPGTACSTIEQHLAGRISADHLRGYTDLVPVAQAAIVGLLAPFGPAWCDDYAIVSMDRGAESWRLRVRGPHQDPGQYDIEVVAVQAPARRLTCRGSAPAASLECTVKAIRSVSSAGLER